MLNGAILQQSFVVEYVVESNMCLDCNRRNANSNTWTACVQVRARACVCRLLFFLRRARF